MTQIFELRDDLKKSLKDEDVEKKDAPTVESLREKYRAQKETEASDSKENLNQADKAEADE